MEVLWFARNKQNTKGQQEGEGGESRANQVGFTANSSDTKGSPGMHQRKQCSEPNRNLRKFTKPEAKATAEIQAVAPNCTKSKQGTFVPAVWQHFTCSSLIHRSKTWLSAAALTRYCITSFVSKSSQAGFLVSELQSKCHTSDNHFSWPCALLLHSLLKAEANPAICNQHTVLCFTHICFQKESRFWSESQPEACPEQHHLGILRSLSLISWNQFGTQLLKGNVVGSWHAHRYRAWNAGLEIWSQMKKPEQQSWN